MRYIYQVIHRVFQKINNELIPSKRFPFNEYGFGGGAPSMPTIPAAPAIAPAPVPTQTNSTPTLEGRQQQVAMLKYGALSTVSNSGGAGGITGAGTDMYPTMTAGTAGSQNRQTTGGQ